MKRPFTDMLAELSIYTSAKQEIMPRSTAGIDIEGETDAMFGGEIDSLADLDAPLSDDNPVTIDQIIQALTLLKQAGINNLTDIVQGASDTPNDSNNDQLATSRELTNPTNVHPGDTDDAQDDGTKHTEIDLTSDDLVGDTDDFANPETADIDGQQAFPNDKFDSQNLDQAISDHADNQKDTNDLGDGIVGDFGADLSGLDDNPEVSALSGNDAPEIDPDRMGDIRTVAGAHLVYKRQASDGTFTELWIYNIGDHIDTAIATKKAIIAGTDIPADQMRSPDNTQTYDLVTMGNAQLLQITGLSS